jgi:cytoskeletal protein RodZ
MIAQLIAAGVLLVFATTGFAFIQEYRDEDKPDTTAVEEQAVPQENQQKEDQAAPSRIQSPTPTPSYRTNCSQIRGTPYTGPEERAWFLTNCLGR